MGSSLGVCRTQYTNPQGTEISPSQLIICPKAETDEGLSALANATLSDGNPYIADLNDVNRPSKIAEQYLELYDNEWDEAFNVIHNVETEENACRILLHLFCDIFEACIKKAEEERETLEQALKNFLGGEETPVDVLKHLKDRRKKSTSGPISFLKKEVKGTVKNILPANELRRDKQIKRFLNKSIELCWHMAVQDPPVFVDVNIKRSDELYDSNLHKAYTKSDIYIDYIVWPTLYLYENGNILCKGVAQCKAKNSNVGNNKRSKSTKSKKRSLGRKIMVRQENEEDTQRSEIRI